MLSYRMLWLVACSAGLPDSALSFEVQGVVPEDGATDVIEAQSVELKMSAEADYDRCTTATVRVDAMLADGTVAFPIESEVRDGGDGARIVVDPVDALPNGWTYAVTLLGGPEGCGDLDGRDAIGFASSFVVP